MRQRLGRDHRHLVGLLLRYAEDVIRLLHEAAAVDMTESVRLVLDPKGIVAPPLVPAFRVVQIVRALATIDDNHDVVEAALVEALAIVVGLL